MVMYGHLWSSMVMCGQVYLCIVMYGNKLLYMVMYDVWLSKVLYGCLVMKVCGWGQDRTDFPGTVFLVAKQL